MQHNESSFLKLVRIGCIRGLIYASACGLPLYCCCAMWFGVIFPRQNYNTPPDLFFVFIVFILLGLALLFRGYWLLSVIMAEKSGSILTGVNTSIWTAIVALLLLGFVYRVSTILGGPLVIYPGNEVRGIFIFNTIYALVPFLLFVGSVVFGALGGSIGERKAEQRG